MVVVGRSVRVVRVLVDVARGIGGAADVQTVVAKEQVVVRADGTTETHDGALGRRAMLHDIPDDGRVDHRTVTARPDAHADSVGRDERPSAIVMDDDVECVEMALNGNPAPDVDDLFLIIRRYERYSDHINLKPLLILS